MTLDFLLQGQRVGHGGDEWIFLEAAGVGLDHLLHFIEVHKETDGRRGVEFLERFLVQEKQQSLFGEEGVLGSGGQEEEEGNFQEDRESLAGLPGGGGENESLGEVGNSDAEGIRTEFFVQHSIQTVDHLLQSQQDFLGLEEKRKTENELAEDPLGRLTLLLVFAGEVLGQHYHFLFQKSGLFERIRQGFQAFQVKNEDVFGSFGEKFEES